MNVAVIPARGGSKRIPGKNIKMFAGQPMIAWSIQAAVASGLFARIIVSTDSEEIAAVARQYGAETPFLRPIELADDFTIIAPVIIHALDWLADHGCMTDYACCIFATAPFMQPNFIREGYDILRQRGAASSFAVTTYSASIYRALKIEKDGSLAMLWPEYELTLSNDLSETYYDAGQFYWLNVPRFLVERKIYAHDARPVVLPRYLVQDIDTQEDWLMAEAMYGALRLQGKIDAIERGPG